MMGKAIVHDDGLAYVSLGTRGEKGVAVIAEADLAMLESLGLSLRWNRHPRTGAVFAPAGKASGSNVLVARVLLDAGKGENVRFKNGDPTDLRRDNLILDKTGYATRRDRDYLTPAQDRRAWGPSVEHVSV